MKLLKKFIALLLLTEIILCNNNAMQAKAVTKVNPSKYTTYTEKKYTSTGLQLGKTYRIYHYKFKYTLSECKKIVKKGNKLSKYADVLSLITSPLSLKADVAVVTTAVIYCLGKSASNEVNFFQKAVSKKKGVSIEYDYYVCMNGCLNGTSNFKKNYKMKYI